MFTTVLDAMAPKSPVRLECNEVLGPDSSDDGTYSSRIVLPPVTRRTPSARKFTPGDTTLMMDTEPSCEMFELRYSTFMVGDDVYSLPTFKTGAIHRSNMDTERANYLAVHPWSCL